jgi:hypothetical protein
MNLFFPAGNISIPLTPANPGAQAWPNHVRMLCCPWIPASAGMSGSEFRAQGTIV